MVLGNALPSAAGVARANCPGDVPLADCHGIEAENRLEGAESVHEADGLIVVLLMRRPGVHGPGGRPCGDFEWAFDMMHLRPCRHTCQLSAVEGAQ